jgi:hypothetical protein
MEVAPTTGEMIPAIGGGDPFADNAEASIQSDSNAFPAVL